MTSYRYRNIADVFENRILEGVYRVGDRLPSTRDVCRAFNVSITTAYHAYAILEQKGLIRAKPQSGYIVLSRPQVLVSHDRALLHDEHESILDLEAIALRILAADTQKSLTPFGSVFADPDLFPIKRLLSLMRTASRRPDHSDFRLHSIAGLADLRREIAKRYARHGYAVSVDEIIVTSGSIDSVNIALSALLRAGDTVAVEDPCFFPTLFSLRRHGLRGVPIPVSPHAGLDLVELERVLATGKVRACVLMSTCQMPMGVSMSNEKKQWLVQLAEKYGVPIIENGAYDEFARPGEYPASCKAFDKSGLVVSCSSFSSSLSPQLRVGWLCAGRFYKRVLSVKLLTSMTSHWIAQRTAAEFLKYENLDRHMASVRSILGKRMSTGLGELDKWSSLVRQRSDPKGGSIVWLALPSEIDSLALFTRAASEGLSFMPGALFSAGRPRHNEIALNFSFPWTEDALESLSRLMKLIASSVDERSRVFEFVNSA